MIHSIVSRPTLPRHDGRLKSSAARRLADLTRTLAHISDPHVGRDAETDTAVAATVRALLEAGVDEVLATGDLTHHGRRSELERFEKLFAPLRRRLIVVPGNHDRLGDDVARDLMAGPRVQTESRPGTFVVRVDSTAPHNRRFVRPDGELTPEDIAAVEAAVASAPAGSLVVLMLHHHLLPLPGDGVGERIAAWLGWQFALELERGQQLVERLRGRCDLILHGHRHGASELVLLPRRGRALHLLNAGCTPELARARLLVHAEGRIHSECWLDVGGGRDVRADLSPARAAGPARAA
jgi:predicted phosphodiesterase